MKRTPCIQLGLLLVFASEMVWARAAGAIIQVSPRALAQQPTSSSLQTIPQLPSYPVKFGAFVARFDPGGTFTLQGQGWPSMSGNWKRDGSEIQFLMSGGPGGCVRRVVNSTRSLENFPFAGRIVPEFGEETIRGVFAYSYRIIYRIENETVTIAAVIHVRRDLRYGSDSLSDRPKIK